jgi:hypothetical protein
MDAGGGTPDPQNKVGLVGSCAHILQTTIICLPLDRFIRADL